MFSINTAPKMAELIRRFEQAGDTWHTPMVRAAMAGDLAFMLVPPGSAVPLRALDPRRQRTPLAVVLCGDECGHPASATDFPRVPRLLRWARFILIHGAAGEAEHYEIVAEATRSTGRALVIECSTAAEADWNALRAQHAPKTPALIVRAQDGLHPIHRAPAGTVMQ